MTPPVTVAFKTTHRIELRFALPPSEAMQTELKRAGWTYSRSIGAWWVRDDPAHRAQAQRIAERLAPTIAGDRS